QCSGHGTNQGSQQSLLGKEEGGAEVVARRSAGAVGTDEPPPPDEGLTILCLAVILKPSQRLS
ncbi:MAG: hypothetical protein MUF81_20780, partial [Verrucomicrobia bacterium]|nr:hypothetical protein [Verrucomicrobiota bacterium]